MNYYIMVLRKYAEFTGRSRRSEYWFFALFNFIIVMVLATLSGMWDLDSNSPNMIFLSLYVVYNLFVLVPSFAVAVRRLHDVGKSGWWLLIGLIPVIGSIWLIVLFATNGDTGSNEYGENPKEVVEA